MFRLDGKRALVTGVNGGLGQAIADALVGQGAVVHGATRNPDLAQKITERYGQDAIVFNQSDLKNINTILDSACEKFGEFDIVCNNAGVNYPQSAVTVDVDTWQEIITVNLSGVFFLSQCIAKRWIKQGIKGTIINISSQAGTVAIENRSAYGSSKAALTHLTKILALEWAKDGIRVNSIAPTFIRTALTESTLSDPLVEKELIARIPLGRLGIPADVIGAVIYLASDSASLVTGHNLVVDGGYTIK